MGGGGGGGGDFGTQCREFCVRFPGRYIANKWNCGRCSDRPVPPPAPTGPPANRPNICKNRNKYISCADGLGTVVNYKRLINNQCTEKCLRSPNIVVTVLGFKCGFCSR